MAHEGWESLHVDTLPVKLHAIVMKKKQSGLQIESSTVCELRASKDTTRNQGTNIKNDEICANDIRRAKAQDKLWLGNNAQEIIKEAKFSWEQAEE